MRATRDVLEKILTLAVHKMDFELLAAVLLFSRAPISIREATMRTSARQPHLRRAFRSLVEEGIARKTPEGFEFTPATIGRSLADALKSGDPTGAAPLMRSVMRRASAPLTGALRLARAAAKVPERKRDDCVVEALEVGGDLAANLLSEVFKLAELIGMVKA